MIMPLLCPGAVERTPAQREAEPQPAAQHTLSAAPLAPADASQPPLETTRSAAGSPAAINPHLYTQRRLIDTLFGERPPVQLARTRSAAGSPAAIHGSPHQNTQRRLIDTLFGEQTPVQRVVQRTAQPNEELIESVHEIRADKSKAAGVSTGELDEALAEVEATLHSGDAAAVSEMMQSLREEASAGESMVSAEAQAQEKPVQMSGWRFAGAILGAIVGTLLFPVVLTYFGGKKGWEIGKRRDDINRLLAMGAAQPQVDAMLAIEPDPVVLIAQVQAEAAANPTRVHQLYVDGATSPQISAMLAIQPNGATLHAQITAEAAQSAANVHQLYVDGATSPEITTLLGFEANGATLHTQILAEATQSAALVLQLYQAGAISAQITTMLALEPNSGTLHLYWPQIQRQIGDGVALDAAMITSVQRQLGAAGKIQEIQEHGGRQNLAWHQQTADLDGTVMGNWILDNTNPEPDPVNGQMNCWEVVMFSAYKMGYIDWQHMHDAYLRDVGRQGQVNQEEQTAYFHTHIQTGAERTFDPNDPYSPKPLRGDIVLFQTAEAHTAMAAGSEIAGSPEVFSLWNRPNHNYLQRVTVGALLAAGADEPVLFFSPRWG